MEITLKRELDQTIGELKIFVPVETSIWKKAQKLAFNALAQKIKVPGYNSGRAPKQELIRRLTPGRIWEEAVVQLLPQAREDATTALKKSDQVLDEPTFAVETITETELELIFIYPVFPRLNLQDYESLTFPFNFPDEATIKADVKERVDQIRLQNSLLLMKTDEDAKVEKGDTVTLDFQGFIDDVAFAGGEAEDYELKIGSGAFIPGFEDQLVDKPLGWTGDIYVTFPASYHKEELRNQVARFAIAIKEIKYNEKPKLDKQFVQSLNIPNINNETELRTYLATLAKIELDAKARAKFLDEFYDHLIKENEIPAPSGMSHREMARLFGKLKENLEKQRITEWDYYKLTGYTEEEVKADLLKEATKNVKKLILQTFFVNEFKIEPTDVDYSREYIRLAKLYNTDVANVKKFVKPTDLTNQILSELIADKLIALYNPLIDIEKEDVEPVFSLEQWEQEQNQPVETESEVEVSESDEVVEFEQSETPQVETTTEEVEEEVTTFSEEESVEQTMSEESSSSFVEETNVDELKAEMAQEEREENFNNYLHALEDQVEEGDLNSEESLTTDEATESDNDYLENQGGDFDVFYQDEKPALSELSDLEDQMNYHEESVSEEEPASLEPDFSSEETVNEVDDFIDEPASSVEEETESTFDAEFSSSFVEEPTSSDDSEVAEFSDQTAVDETDEASDFVSSNESFDEPFSYGQDNEDKESKTELIDANEPVEEEFAPEFETGSTFSSVEETTSEDTDFDDQAVNETEEEAPVVAGETPAVKPANKNQKNQNKNKSKSKSKAKKAKSKKK